jgi:hypothetical protein
MEQCAKPTQTIEATRLVWYISPWTQQEFWNIVKTVKKCSGSQLYHLVVPQPIRLRSHDQLP